MDIDTELKLSYYKPVAVIDAEHNVVLVQHTETRQIFVMKTLAIYDLEVFACIQKKSFHGIPQIHELLQDNGKLTVIEEHINGETLESLLEREKNLPFDQAVNIIISLCDILKPMHENIPPIIHRDIKPSNIMISSDNRIFLLDMNAARLATPDKDSDTRLLGTRGYAAPEQYGFGASGKTTDIYALGKILEEMLPTPLNNKRSSMLKTVIERCTRLDPDMRYQSVDQLRLELERILNGKYISTATKRFPYFPPGYRNPSLFKSIIVTPLYLFVLLLCLGLTVKDASLHILYINRAIAMAMTLSIIFFSANYLNIHEKLPLCRSHILPIRLLGIILYDFILFCAWIILLLILEALLV